MHILDTGSIIYQSRQLDISKIIHNIQEFTGTKFEIENNKYLFRNIKIDKLEFINFISVTELRENVRITVSYSYSRYENKDNYKLATRQRTINDVHSALVRVFRAITGLLITAEQLEVIALDISNQLEVENIRNYYNVLNLIYRAFKRVNTNGRLYFDTDDKSRLQLDGLDFRERGKKRREASSYFKIYSKRKEIEDTKGLGAAKGKATALRGELTLKGMSLRKWGLDKIPAINKDNLDRVLKATLAQTLILYLNKELEDNVNILKKSISKSKTKKIRETILMNEYFIFDIEILDVVLTPEILGVSNRMVQYHTKAILELLEANSKNGEVKKVYTKNFIRLKKLLKKITKAEIKINKDDKGVRLEWQD